MKSTRFVLQAKDGSFYKGENSRFGVSFDEAHVFPTEKQADKVKTKLDAVYKETDYTVQPIKIEI